MSPDGLFSEVVPESRSQTGAAFEVAEGAPGTWTSSLANELEARARAHSNKVKASGLHEHEMLAGGGGAQLENQALDSALAVNPGESCTTATLPAPSSYDFAIPG